MTDAGSVLEYILGLIIGFAVPNLLILGSSVYVIIVDKYGVRR